MLVAPSRMPATRTTYTSRRAKSLRLAAEDEHAAGNGHGCKRDRTRDRAGYRLLNLLQWPFPWEAAAGTGEHRRDRGKNDWRRHERGGDEGMLTRHGAPPVLR